MVGLAAIGALDGRTARAGDVDVAANLDYLADPDCPAAAEFESVVANHLGYSPFRDDAAEHVVVRVGAAGHGLEGRLEWRKEDGGLSGERTFPSRTGDCAELVRAMGFALAVQFQLLATAEAPVDAPPPPPPPPPPPTVRAPPAPSPPPRDSSSGPAVAAGAGASAAVGLATDVTAVGRVFGSVMWQHLALELATEISVPSTTRRADGAGFSQQAFLVSLAGCGVVSRFSGCLLGKIGELRVSGDRVDSPTTSSGLILQAGLRLAMTQTLGHRAYVVAHADTVALLTRGIVTLDAMPVWTTPRVAATFGLDFAVRFR